MIQYLNLERLYQATQKQTRHNQSFSLWFLCLVAPARTHLYCYSEEDNLNPKKHSNDVHFSCLPHIFIIIRFYFLLLCSSAFRQVWYVLNSKSNALWRYLSCVFFCSKLYLDEWIPARAWGHGFSTPELRQRHLRKLSPHALCWAHSSQLCHFPTASWSQFFVPGSRVPCI